MVGIIALLDAFGRSMMVGVLASITVGPVAVLAIQRTLSKSRRSGLVSGLGIAVADTVMAVAAYFFYAMLQGHIEAYNILLRIVGGIFVVGMGVYIFFQNPVPQVRQNRKGGDKGWWHDFISIFGLTMANFVMVIPYILAFFAVFKISAGMEGDYTASEALQKGVAVCVGFFTGSICWWTMLASVISLFKKGFKPRHMLTINHCAGLLIGGLGAFTIISTVVTLIM
ncbi:MAG: LysE family transporter [Rikenellaceae bacterium]